MEALKLSHLENERIKKDEKVKLKFQKTKKINISACHSPCEDFKKDGVIVSDVSQSAHWNID